MEPLLGVTGKDPELAAAAGFRFIRRDFRWDEIEARPGEYDFEVYDDFVDRAEAAGIEILALMCYGNPPYSSRNDRWSPPDDLGNFARFVADVATRYRGRIEDFEIWNEPNVGLRFWKPNFGGDPARYGELLRTTYRAVKPKMPEARIVHGGLFGPKIWPLIPSGREFLAEVLEHHSDIRDYLDVLAFHPYSFPQRRPERASWFERSIAELRRDIPDAPLWITECGWHTSQKAIPFDAVSARAQADYLVRAAVLAFAAGIPRFTWFTLMDRSRAHDRREHGFGVVTHRARRPKASFGAVRRLSAALSGTVFDRRLDTAPDVHAYRFKGREPMEVVWCETRSRTIDLEDHGRIEIGPTPIIMN